MSVEFEPKKDGCVCFGVSNGTWFTLANTSGIKEIIPHQSNNDPIDIDEDTAKIMAEAIRNWVPPEGWFMEGREGEGKRMFIHFFQECGGFTTR